MANPNEPAKLLLPYLQRADELQKHEPLVAYYCRLYAMERGLKIPQTERTKTTNSLLMSLINQLEKDKKSLKLSPDDSLHVEGFALNVFGKADKQDHAGRADLNTAKTFYAASIFFDILSQFGPLPPDLEQKHKYAIWKAADIRKALKEGRKPTPGPPVSDEDLFLPSSAPSGTYDTGPSETMATSPRTEHDPSHHVYDNANSQHFTDVPPPQPHYHDSMDNEHPNISPSTQPHYHDKVNTEHPPSIPPSPPYHRTSSFQTDDPPPSSNISENSPYPQPYHPHPYQQEPPPQHLPQNYPSHETPPYSYSNFPSYPSFTETSLPSAPAHNSYYYQASDSTHSPHSTTSNYASVSPTGRNGTVPDPTPQPPPPAQKYQYDSNYQPSAEKIAEAHKAARFAVGALAFDDVSVAVDFLQKSLELLTNPSGASQ